MYMLKKLLYKQKSFKIFVKQTNYFRINSNGDIVRIYNRIKLFSYTMEFSISFDAIYFCICPVNTLECKYIFQNRKAF